MPTSDSYYDDLILRLKDTSYASLYLETHFELEEGEEPDPKLLKLALSNVAEALGEENMTPEQAKSAFRKTRGIAIAQRGSEAIYNLGTWLNALGLKLTVTVAENGNNSNVNATINSQLTVN